MKKKVSFDFDSTLDKPFIQLYASDLISRGFEVWIVTSRMTNEEAKEKNGSLDWNSDLFKVANELGIVNKHIHFTSYQLKADFFLDKDFIWHLDDDWVELRHINSKTKTIAISCFGSGDWKSKCERILKKNKW